MTIRTSGRWALDCGPRGCESSGRALQRGWRDRRRAGRCLQKQVGWLGQSEQKEVPGLGCDRNRCSKPACLLTAPSAWSQGWLEVLRYQDEAPRSKEEESFFSRTGPKEQHLTPGWVAEPSSGTDSQSVGCRDLPCPLTGPSAEKKRGFVVMQNLLEARRFHLARLLFV